MSKKKEWLAASLLAAVVCGPALGQDAAKPTPAPAMGGMGMGSNGMMGGMMTDAMREEHLKSKQENFLKMVDLSNKILAAKDEKERERLKAEQLQLMKDHEKAHQDMMHKHMQQMMQQGGGMGGMQHGGGAGAAGMGGMQHGPGSNAGGMGGMQHGAPAATPTPPQH